MTASGFPAAVAQFSMCDHLTVAWCKSTNGATKTVTIGHAKDTLRMPSMCARARHACIDQVASNQSFGPDQIRTSDVRWAGCGMLTVSPGTPSGKLTCSVDRDGNVRSIDRR